MHNNKNDEFHIKIDKYYVLLYNIICCCIYIFPINIYNITF